MGVLGNNYGNFAPQLFDVNMDSISQMTISAVVIGGAGPNVIEINLPQGVGSPWVSGATVEITIQTNTAQGSMTVTLPS
ncbi:MAG: hypothetical protein ABR909_10870 [Candidatus Bathyarchaeia archaeon]|jgi:hypothetical protein